MRRVSLLLTAGQNLTIHASLSHFLVTLILRLFWFPFKINFICQVQVWSETIISIKMHISALIQSVLILELEQKISQFPLITFPSWRLKSYSDKPPPNLAALPGKPYSHLYVYGWTSVSISSFRSILDCLLAAGWALVIFTHSGDQATRMPLPRKFFLWQQWKHKRTRPTTEAHFSSVLVTHLLRSW